MKPMGLTLDEVIMAPEVARRRGLTSTVTFTTGNLAPAGSVVKSTANDPEVVDPDGVYRKVGSARVFTSERAAIAAIKGRADKSIRPGDIIVLMGRGPLGCGMEETYQLTSALKFLPWGKEVALITDARFSGVSTGACIGHVGPEALAGGPIGRIQEGDTIQIVIDQNNLAGRIDLIGHGGQRLAPRKGLRCWRLAPLIPTLRPTLTCRMIPGWGVCKMPAAAPGVAVFLMWIPLSRYWRQAGRPWAGKPASCTTQANARCWREKCGFYEPDTGLLKRPMPSI